MVRLRVQGHFTTERSARGGKHLIGMRVLRDGGNGVKEFMKQCRRTPA